MVVIPSITGTTANLSEDKVADKCFDLIFAFDEVIFPFSRKSYVSPMNCLGDHNRRIS